MTFELRFVVIVLAAFAWSSLATASIVPALFRRRRHADAAARAQFLIRVRALPALVGLATAALAATAFVLFEPRVLDEDYGLVLRGLAGVSAVVIGGAMMRGLSGWMATRRVVAAWFRSARPITLPGISIPAVVADCAFPVVAVTGLLSPRLLIARRVLDACSDEEIRAILAHEQAHVDRRDNLRRLFFAAAPDVLAWLPVSTRLAAAWQQASEDAADDAAHRLGPDGRVVLAQALVRVARLAPAGRPIWLPTSALYRGEAIERRVERLLAPMAPKVAPHRWSSRAAVACVVIGSAAALEAVHEALELAAALLP